MILLVTGGRDYYDVKRVRAALDKLHDERTIRILIQGGGTGADAIAKAWARDRLVPCATVPAYFDSEQKRSAGPIRNSAMLYLGPTLVYAFPGGRGTADMVKKAKKTHIPVKEFLE